ncbi:hypothetical protein [Caenimonas aquaedulcis]|uniref:Uncharacterized protein n=1 Tax=Caenimonas aquaedulcis TaxID=2793270 RepID=A0A931MH22_9BURK|nr:hypothetical protein [Caenimonas aquaedulcis]MBG9388354.1 hypothetical protein [Caenimonas aquaedulcis]
MSATLEVTCEAPANVWGPFGNMYIAAYSSRLASSKYMAYAKVFPYRPRDFWDGCGLAKFATDMQWASSAAAILDAVFIAQYAVERRLGIAASRGDTDFETTPAPLEVLRMG